MIETIEEYQQTMDMLYGEIEQLKEELAFLRKRNSELRQKTYINVYDENLKMQDKIKALKHENEVKFNDLVKYEKTIEQLRKELMQVGAVADKYYKDAVRLNQESQNRYEETKKLKGVLQSVQTFLDEQITK